MNENEQERNKPPHPEAPCFYRMIALIEGAYHRIKTIGGEIKSCNETNGQQAPSLMLDNVLQRFCGGVESGGRHEIPEHIHQLVLEMRDRYVRDEGENENSRRKECEEKRKGKRRSSGSNGTFGDPMEEELKHIVQREPFKAGGMNFLCNRGDKSYRGGLSDRCKKFRHVRESLSSSNLSFLHCG